MSLCFFPFEALILSTIFSVSWDKGALSAALAVLICFGSSSFVGIVSLFSLTLQSLSTSEVDIVLLFPILSLFLVAASLTAVVSAFPFFGFDLSEEVTVWSSSVSLQHFRGMNNDDKSLSNPNVQIV